MSIKDDLIKFAIEKLEALNKYDREKAHGKADDILLELLDLLGYEEVVEAYEKIKEEVGFWYA